MFGRKYWGVVILILCLTSGCGFFKSQDTKEQDDKGKKGWETGLTDEEKRDVREKVLDTAESYRDIYESAKAGTGQAALSPQQIHEMVGAAAKSDKTVICSGLDDNMRNYEPLLSACRLGTEKKESRAELYSITSEGGLVYFLLQFSDGELTVTQANMNWSDGMEPVVDYMDKVNVYTWSFTDKGWLIWEKYKSVNQEMDMHCMYRVLPLPEDYREICALYIAPVSYMGNNLFLAEWDETTLNRISWNDLYEFLYPMRYGKALDRQNYAEGIPKEEFEDVMMAYFQTDAEFLEANAGYDETAGRYPWAPIVGGTLVPQYQPLPEVVDVKEEGVLLYVTVDAVLSEDGSDKAFSHRVTLQKSPDGSVTYMGNQILRFEGEKVPGYIRRTGTVR